MDPTNIAGMASILSTNNINNTAMLKLEEDIMQLHKFKKHNEENDNVLTYYKESLAEVSKDIGIDLENDDMILNNFNSNSNSNSNANSYPNYNSNANSNTNYEDNRYIETVTNEQKKQAIIDNVISEYPQVDDVFDIEKTREDDEKDVLLEQIDSLIDILTDDGINISRIPKVDRDSSLEQIKSVLKWLTIKNDRMRYGTLADEIILAGCGALERIFDGKKQYFGTSPDLTGWSDSARIKLSRSRYVTSSMVGNVFSSTNIGPASRLFIEFLPSIMLYSQRRKEIRMFDNNEYNKSINELNE